MYSVPKRGLYLPTERDGKIIETIALFRALSSEQVNRLHFPPVKPEGRKDKVSSNAKNRLRLLCQHGYLFRIKQLHSPTIYWLDTKGAKYLSTFTDLPSQSYRFHRSERNVTAFYLNHLLKTNDTRIEAVLSAARGGFTIDDWRDEREMRRTHISDRVSVQIDNDRREEFAVIPDGYFHLVTPQRDFHNLFEVDLRSEVVRATAKDARDIARKIRGYLEYFPKRPSDNNSLFEKRYGTKRGRLLFITTGERRLAHIKTLIEDLGGAKRYWLTTFERLSQGDYFTAPIWSVATEKERLSLVW